MAAEASTSIPQISKLQKGFKNDLFKSAIAGGAAGLTQVQSDSILSTGHVAGIGATAEATIGGALGGAAAHGAFKLPSEITKRIPEKFVLPEPNKLNDGLLKFRDAVEEDEGLKKSMLTADVLHTDGSSTKVIVRSLDTTEDAWALTRVKRAVTVARLHKIEGYEGTAPSIAVRTEHLNGAPQPVSVQEYAGNSFGGKVRIWAAEATGLHPREGMALGDEIYGKDIANLIKDHPALFQATAEGFARKLADGGLDLNLSNWSIPETVDGTARPDGPVHLYDIDPKRGFGLNTIPNYGPEIKFGDAPHVVKLLEGKKLGDISSALQEKFDGLVGLYDSPSGIDLMRSAGLTGAEAKARLARIKSLANNGFPPFMGIPIPPPPLEPIYYDTPEYNAAATSVDEYLLEKARKLKLPPIKIQSSL